MKRKLLTTLLAASLAFNLFFAIGYFRAQGHIKLTRTAEGRAELFIRQLDLDKDQIGKVRDLRNRYFAEKNKRSATKYAEYDAFWAEMIKDAPDEAVLEKFVKSASGSERRARFVKYMSEFMQMLRPEQRRQVVDVVRSRRSGSQPRKPAPSGAPEGGS